MIWILYDQDSFLLDLVYICALVGQYSVDIILTIFIWHEGSGRKWRHFMIIHHTVGVYISLLMVGFMSKMLLLERNLILYFLIWLSATWTYDVQSIIYNFHSPNFAKKWWLTAMITQRFQRLLACILIAANYGFIKDGVYVMWILILPMDTLDIYIETGTLIKHYTHIETIELIE